MSTVIASVCNPEFTHTITQFIRPSTKIVCAFVRVGRYLGLLNMSQLVAFGNDILVFSTLGTGFANVLISKYKDALKGYGAFIDRVEMIFRSRSGIGSGTGWRNSGIVTTVAGACQVKLIKTAHLLLFLLLLLFSLLFLLAFSIARPIISAATVSFPTATGFSKHTVLNLCTRRREY